MRIFPSSVVRTYEIMYSYNVFDQAALSVVSLQKPIEGGYSHYISSKFGCSDDNTWRFGFNIV